MLFINVLVVFASVIWRYALHSPIHWAEEVARALMIALVFFGVATSTAKGGHIGVDLFLRFLPERVRPYVVHASRWILFLVSVGLVVSSYDWCRPRDCKPRRPVYRRQSTSFRC